MAGKTGMLIRGLGIGMAVGGAAAMIGASMMSPSLKRQSKRNAMKAMKTFNGLMDDMQHMMK